MDKITLIIPLYNAEAYIARCLDSAINQTYENYEIIVVNDGSTDQSLEICKAYQNRCSYLRIIHRSQNRGQVYTVLEGISEASGDYIAFMDSDDCVDRQYLKSLASGIAEGAQIVCCNHNKVFSDRILLQTERILPGIYNREQIIRDVFPKLLNNGTYLSRGISPHRYGKLFSKELLQNNLSFCSQTLRFGEDLNMFFAAILDCSKLMILDDRQGLYHYHQNEGSVIYTYKATMFQQIIHLREKLLEIMAAKNVYDFEDQINRDFWGLFIDYVKNATTAPDLSSAYRNVCSNFEVAQNAVPWKSQKLKPADKVLMFSLQKKFYSMVHLWMNLYAFLKKG